MLAAATTSGACSSRTGSASSFGRNRRSSSRTAVGTSTTSARGLRSAHSRAKLPSSAATCASPPAHEQKTWKLSQLCCQPCGVSLMLPANATRSPVLSSITPAFSWNSANPATGRRPASHGTATFTSRKPLATIHASSSSASPSVAPGATSGIRSRLTAATSRSASPCAIAAASGSASVQPISRRMRPLLRTSASTPRAASVSAPAAK